MTVKVLASPPSLRRVYARAIATSRGRKGDSLPDTELRLAGLKVGADRLASYDEVCGFRLSDELPPTFPHILAFPLSMALLSEPEFPFPLVGLVHASNRITQRRPLRLGEALDVSVRAADLRPHRRGRLFDVLASVSAGGEEVWSGVSTYIRIEKTPAREGGSRSEPEPEPVPPSAVWRIGPDVGRRYAAVSGDYNPIHLHPLAARLFGFRRTIAHGMWQQARALAALEGRLPAALVAEAEFKAPMFLPARIAFHAHPGSGGWEVSLRDYRTGRVHLSGSVRGSEPARAGGSGRGSRARRS